MLAYIIILLAESDAVLHGLGIGIGKLSLPLGSANLAVSCRSQSDFANILCILHSFKVILGRFINGFHMDIISD